MSNKTSVLSSSVADVESSDEIYLYCTKDCKPRTTNGEEQKSHDDDEKEQCYEIHIFCKRGPSTVLLLVSRQFSFEYQDIVKKQAEIHLYDEYLNCNYNGWAPPLSDHVFAQFSNAKLCLLECGAHLGVDDLENHCKWISAMQHQFGMLSKVDITLRLTTPCDPVYYPNNPSTEGSGFLEKVTKLIDLTGASSLEVIMGRSRGAKGWTGLSRDDVFQNTSTVYGKWSKEGGWVVEAEMRA